MASESMEHKKEATIATLIGPWQDPEFLELLSTFPSEEGCDEEELEESVELEEDLADEDVEVV
jgi:hypothetical protein